MTSDFLEVYLKHYKQVYGACHFILGNHELAVEAANEAFKEFFTKKRAFSPTEYSGKLLALLACKSAAFLPEQHDPLAAKDNRTNREILEAIQRLEPQMKQNVVLKYYLGLDEEEISRHLLLPLEMVKAALQGAKEKIRINLSEIKE